MSISDKIKIVRDKIAESAIQSGRNIEDVKLVAVTKYVDPADKHIEEFIKNGCTDFGESRVQSLLDKVEYFNQTASSSFSINVTKNELRWHMIGTLQRNKIRRALPYISLIHSVDSERLAESIDRIAEEELIRHPIECLLEIAISGDKTKHGFDSDPSMLSDAIGRLGQLGHLRIVGLMCMSGLLSDENETRREFENVRKIAEKLKSQKLPDNCSINELSMGMSDDFEIAIKEGATIVRIGRLLYE
ncbi:MAG: YggS family pyridoxal phosphate-dependent enzyme [Planctomycetaceae bacterium]|jgi:pyridoxal phosphate enzyme (YggS family)|nr:YggS family pyridoxal phosphate-dependent enzyme [Planctomycetaceae bacterium]